jgi:PAS domain S-box-containing protein
MGELYPSDGDAETFLAQLQERHSLTNYEIRGRRKDGRTLWLLQNAALLENSNGVADSVGGAVVDITDRKQREEALRQSEAHYRLVLETAADAFFTLGPNGRILYANAAAERIFGYRREQILGQDFSLLMPEARRELRRIGIRRYPETEERQLRWKPVELIGLHRNGQEIRLEVSFGEFLGDSEHAFTAIVRDRTTQQRAVEALQTSEGSYRMLFERDLAGVYRSTANGRILDCNESFARMFGFGSRAEVLGRRTGELYPTQKDRRAFLARLREQRSLTNYEIRGRRKDGLAVWLLQNAVLSSGENAGRDLIVGSVVDITDRKEAEKAVRQLPGRILQAQDEERRRLARELHDSSAQTATCVAMNLALAMKFLAQAHPKARHLLLDSIAMVKNLSQELRTLSYLLHPPLLDELGLGAALRSFTRGFAERSKLQVLVDLPRNLGRLPNDVELTLFRIAQESLTNIHRHSGSKLARLRLARASEHVTLTVTDRGRGIPREHLEKILNRYSRSQLGVGIPGMRERVRQMGGQFRVSSGSRGTTVTAILPLGKVES